MSLRLKIVFLRDFHQLLYLVRLGFTFHILKVYELRYVRMDEYMVASRNSIQRESESLRNGG